MPYIQTLNTLNLSAQEKQFLKAEFDAIYADLATTRAVIAALLAKLDGVNAVDPSLAEFPSDFESEIPAPSPNFKPV